MRGLVWVGIVVAGIIAMLPLIALMGRDDDENKTVPALEWVSDTCGNVQVWRGEIEDVADTLRAEGVGQALRAPTGASVEQVARATDTLLQGLENNGVPDTPNGQQSADTIETWARTALDDLNAAADTQQDAGDSVQERVNATAGSAAAISGALTSGAQTVADVFQTDPDLAAAFAQSDRCGVLRTEGE